MRTERFNYHLPAGLIAQYPAPNRDGSRLLVIHRDTGRLAHRRFADILEYLLPGDVVVLNDTRVFPARLRGRRESSGGAVEVLLVRPAQEEEKPPGSTGGSCWWCLTRSGGRLTEGETILVGPGEVPAACELVQRGGQAGDLLFWRGFSTAEVWRLAQLYGEVPLPPYLKRAPGPSAKLDRERYQTVYAQKTGAVAAPTAGLHFTEKLLAQVRSAGIGVETITLHVGPGTFRPVKSRQVERHIMQAEWTEVPSRTAAALRQTRACGGRIVAVGSTVVRTLEAAARASPDQLPRPGARFTDLFLYPPCEFRATDVLLTNFHLPQSTLLMMVAAFCAPGSEQGIELILSAYQEAIRRKYRFFSYGDACLIL